MYLWFPWEFIFIGANIMSRAQKMPDFGDEQKKRPGGEGRVSLNSAGVCEFLELLWRRLTIFSNIENE